MECPHCNTRLDSVHVEAAATVVTRAMVTADVRLDGYGPDVAPGNVGGDRRRRTLRWFRYRSTVKVLERGVDAHDLELDRDDQHQLNAWCPRCNGDLTRWFRDLVPQPARERAVV